MCDSGIFDLEYFVKPLSRRRKGSVRFVFTGGVIDVVQLFGYDNEFTGGIRKLSVHPLVDKLCGLLQLGNGEGIF